MTTLRTNEKPSVVFVPGGMTPVEIAYAPLLSVIGNQIQSLIKELELYETDAPPPNCGLELEVEGIRRVVDDAGLKCFHLVGYSGGGAISLAFTAKYPERLRSLALIEPAWIGAPTDEDAADWGELKRVMQLPPGERMQAFRHWHFRPGMEPPASPQPSGPPPTWMAKRPAGLEAMFRAFNKYDLDQNRFRRFNQPVYFALGSLSTRFFEREAKTLAGLFPDMQVEEYVGRSHFDPPHRAEGERFTRALQKLWERTNTTTAVEA
jgi:pimeloyl-ACP methyl ester carboxylesterase